MNLLYVYMNVCEEKKDFETVHLTVRCKVDVRKQCQA